MAASGPPTPPQPKRARGYKDFLTPALHRRFSYAAALVFAICYAESILMSPPSLFWLWNPISLTGIRAILLFLPCLAVFIVRVANLHCGSLTSTSSANALVSQVMRWRGLHTLAWYFYSAFFFGEIYIWSRGKEAHLGWVNAGREDEWALLNENPIFLRAFLYCLATAQAVMHLTRDYDRLAMPPITTISGPTPTQQKALPRSIAELQPVMPMILGRMARLIVPGLAFTVPLYFLSLRFVLWPWYYAVGRTLFTRLATQSRPTGLEHVPRLVWQCLSSSFLLTMLWEISNAIFTIYTARPPLNKTETEPLTGIAGITEKSRDPNESLISGLKSKKETPKAFAFWELNIICRQFDVRRRTIYTEVDRAGSSTWGVISQLCLDELSAIQSRIKATQKLEEPSTNTVKLDELQPGEKQTHTFDLPRIADRTVQNGNVWDKPRPDFVQSVSNLARSAGQDHGTSSPLVYSARKAIEWSAGHVWSKEGQARFSPGQINKQASGWIQDVLRTSVGQIFRQTFADKVKVVIFGHPYSAKITIMHASQSLGTLCSHSLKEDDFGQVSKTVAVIIRTYAETIRAIQTYVQTATPDWTDVDFAPGDRKVDEVEELLDCLKHSLEDVVLTFGEYASSINVTKKELREARELIGKGQEMRTVR